MPDDTNKLPLTLEMPIAAVEVQEFLFSQQLTRWVVASQNAKEALTEDEFQKRLAYKLRELLRSHRFVIMNWLLLNQVGIPSRCVSDDNHPIVGCQCPDHSSLKSCAPVHNEK